jgi:hypothetical protein
MPERNLFFGGASLHDIDLRSRSEVPYRAVALGDS